MASTGKYSLVLFCCFAAAVTALSIDELYQKFGANPCIAGYIVSSEDGTKKIISDAPDSKNVNYHSVVEVISDKEAKTVLSQFHELADFNKIAYSYTLTKEDGPPHSRTFTVSLKLGEETYSGTGPNLKEAKRMAASKALQTTEYEPSPNTKSTLKTAQKQTPTVLLNNVANKLGLAVSYEFLKNPIMTNAQGKVENKPKKSYLQVLNSSMVSNMKKYENIEDLGGPYHVLVTVDKDQYFATAHTKQEAKHRAAEIALEALVMQSKDKQSVCFRDPMSLECHTKKTHLKNPISLVYEAAQIRNMDVQFDVIAETGPNHRREFTTQCTLGQFATQGTGNSKKESKRVAAAMMLENIPHLPEVPLENRIVSSLKTKPSKKKKNKLKRAIVEETGSLSGFVGNIVSSVLGHDTEDVVHSDYDSTDNKEEPDSLDNNEDSVQDWKKTKTSGSQQLLLELSTRNKIEVNFMDVGAKNGKHFVLVVLHQSPTYLCLGMGVNGKLAHELAAENALELLFKQGLIADLPEETDYVVDEGECPEESVSIIVDPSGLNMK